ncbi:hypothetical protein JCM12178A_24980 [Salidesulfovibrio brasiliensis]
MLCVRRQFEILKLQRSIYYYQPIGESAYNLALMKRIDELFMELPFLAHDRCVSSCVTRTTWSAQSLSPAHAQDGVDGS